jgi:DNA-binding NarL/FixJ family response regulator
VAAFQKHTTTPGTSDNDLATLSNREKEILELLSRGLMYKEIARPYLSARKRFVKHVYHVYEKLHVSNRVEAVNKFYGR